MLKPGIHPKLDIVDYHSDHSAVSKTGLVYFRRSPNCYKQVVEGKHSKPDTDSMRTGKALHTCVLEPDLVGDLIVKPDQSILGKNGARSTSAYKAWAADQQKAGKIIVTDAQWEEVNRMVDNVYHNPLNLQARELLEVGPAEVTFVWDDVTRVKARPDKLPGAPVVVNLKSTRDASPEAFGKQSFNLHYHYSAFLDTLGITTVTGIGHFEYYLIAVENKPPFDVAVYRVPPQVMELAQRDCEPLLADLAWCQRNNEWPGYGSAIKELQFPGYAFK